MTPPLHILILAAGASRRMRGGDKLLEPVDGVAQLRRLADTALATGLPVTVTLPPDRPARAVALAGCDVAHVTVPDAALGLSASLRAGLSALPQGAVMLVLADLPDLTTDDMAHMVQAHAATPDLILRGAAQSGVAGHPVIFPADLRPALLALTGDQGARDVIRAHQDRLRLIPLPENHAITDLDTPEEWAYWRAQTGR